MGGPQLEVESTDYREGDRAISIILRDGPGNRAKTLHTLVFPEALNSRYTLPPQNTEPLYFSEKAVRRDIFFQLRDDDYGRMFFPSDLTHAVCEQYIKIAVRLETPAGFQNVGVIGGFRNEIQGTTSRSDNIPTS